MNFIDFISLAKLFSAVVYGNISPTQAEMKTACELLKTMGSNRNGWSPQQKEIYKEMVNYIEDHI